MKPRTDLLTSLRFFLSPRAGFWAKLMLLFAVMYVILPIDFVPDVAVVVGWIDDLVVLLGALALLLGSLRRFQRENAALAPPVPVAGMPRVIETQGSEVR
jgi:uncharacterized membrane protein YkvA (DUF1232 family)